MFITDKNSVETQRKPSSRVWKPYWAASKGSWAVNSRLCPCTRPPGDKREERFSNLLADALDVSIKQGILMLKYRYTAI